MEVAEVFGLAVSNGLFATLFVYLLYWVLKDSHKREEKYNETMNKIIEQLGNTIKEVKIEVGDIKLDLKRINEQIKDVSKKSKREKDLNVVSPNAEKGSCCEYVEKKPKHFKRLG